jgi:DNA polymerase elongation subunit (family B)
MIVNYEYNNGKLLVSYIDNKGKLQFKNYNWQNPLQWTVTHERDVNKSNDFHTWDGKPVKHVNVRYPNRYSVLDFLYNLPDEEKNDIFSYNEPQMFFCDIEVEVTDGFPEAHIAANPITAVCLINNNKVFLMGLKPFTDTEIDKMTKDLNKHFEKHNTEYTIQWHHCEDEVELLNIFFNNLMPKIPVLTGWNFVGYDWVYFVTRARKLGINPNVASPTGKLIRPWKKTENIQKPSYEELPKHRLVFDYMDIFKKWDTSIKIKESDKLDFVSDKLLGTKKLEMKYSIKDMYHKDWYTYCLYNCIDTALVQLIHKKQRTFDIMLAISNLAKIQIEDAPSAIRVTEGILFKDYKEIGIVMAKSQNTTVLETPPENDIDIDDELLGGYVKYPSVDLKSWITVFDFASLYPTTMMQFNIAPESYRGIKINESMSILNGKEYVIKSDDIVLLNNTVFENKDSRTKQIISNIFKDRKKNKNIGLAHKKQEQLIKDYYNNRFK